MAGLDYFRVYAAETLSDGNFQGWSVDERGAWFTLLLVAWREGSIPSDETSLAKLLHVDSSAMRALWSAIGSRFVEHLDFPGRLTSPRLEMEREAAEKAYNQKVAAGKLGATSRWSKTKRKHSGPIAPPWQADGRPMAGEWQADSPSFLPSLPPSIPSSDVPIVDTGEWKKRRDAQLASIHGGQP
jgi:uncharacterized protein YdaU (DUF1376 family)